MRVGGGTVADLRWANDRAILVSFEGASSAPALVRAFVRALAAAAPPAIVDIHPAYASVLVVIDPLSADPEQIAMRLRGLAEHLQIEDLPAPRRITIPIVYGGEFGPDLDEVARLTGRDRSEVIRCHAEALYTVAFLGFVPGFAYMTGLPEELRVPRHSAPRRRVLPGSLGIAAGQTAIYPLSTPGGWRLIGRTPLFLFRADRNPPAMLDVGDQVTFEPIDPPAFERIAREISR